jgi:hypothetical protein
VLVHAAKYRLAAHLGDHVEKRRLPLSRTGLLPKSNCPGITLARRAETAVTTVLAEGLFALFSIVAS